MLLRAEIPLVVCRPTCPIKLRYEPRGSPPDCGTEDGAVPKRYTTATPAANDATRDAPSSPMTHLAHAPGMPVDGTLARGTLGLEIGGDWMSASRPLSAGFVATTMRRSSTNAPQRAGRGAMEGRDERAGVKMAVIRSRSSFAHRCARRRSTAQRPRRTTRPGTRTLVGGHAAAFVAGRDTPLVNERAANARAHRKGRWR